MNNYFLEGPIQTGKSTYLRKILKAEFGPNLTGVAGFTSQRVVSSEGELLGFGIAPAAAEILYTAGDQTETSWSQDGAAGVPTDSTAGVPASTRMFKTFGPAGPRVDMSVFETYGVELLEDAIAKAKSGEARVVLLDEIGGHEMVCPEFTKRLYELLDMDVRCVGVIKHPASAKRMDPSILALNEELHKKITGEDSSAGEIEYFERQR